MIISGGNRVYEWIDNWANIAGTQGEGFSGRTHGVVVTKDNSVIVFRHADPAILILAANGKIQAAWGQFAGAHGLTLVEENGAELLWLTDTGTGKVVQTTLEGEKLFDIARPDHEFYHNGKYVPTWVAVNEERTGGNGDIWVADGYGQSLVHRYDQSGNYILTLTGAEGAGRFKCPHNVWFDNRKAEPELYIADRGNSRVQIYDAEGNFKREFGRDFLSQPCSFALENNRLVVAELCARLTFLDEKDDFEFYLGQNESVCERETYPNARELLEPGKFHAPHAAVFDQKGDLYVVEWIIGGRITKLVLQDKYKKGA